MKKIYYIDITGILKSPVLVGADKVTAGITIGMIDNNIEPYLIAFSQKHNSYVAVDKLKYYSYIAGRLFNDESCYTDTIVRINSMERESVFLDTGNSWLNVPQRGWLLPKIKNKSIKIISMIQSFLPLNYPDRVSEQTRIKFMHYIVACMRYADKIIVPSEETAENTRRLFKELKISPKPIIIVHFCANSEIIRDNKNTLSNLSPEKVFLSDEVEYFIKSCSRFKNIIKNAHMCEVQKKLQYRSPTWPQAVRKIIHAAGTQGTDLFEHKPVKQIVYLSARPEALVDTLPFIEKFMTFITEMVICCPDTAGEYLKANYKGNLKVTIVTDDQLLAGHDLPKDHATRNLFLRCLMMERDEIDEEFIMSDDDYRPLTEIKEEVFFSNGMYNVYYLIDLSDWKHTVGELFSYDYSMFKTLEFLKENGYPTLQYSAHQPQIINKNWYRELISEHKDIMLSGYDEWSTYFNFCAVRHSKYFRQLPYVTLGWPNVGTCWQYGVRHSAFLFENFYIDNYNENRIFSELSPALSENIYEDNRIKTQKAFMVQKECQESFDVYDQYVEEYILKYGHIPSITICCSDMAENDVDIYVPHFYRMKDNVINNMRFYIARMEYTICNKKNIDITAWIQNNEGSIISSVSVVAAPVQTETGCHLRPAGEAKTYVLHIRCTVENTDICTEAEIPLEIV